MSVVKQTQTGDVVLPGDRLGVIEEFIPGSGTYEEEGVIFSSIQGQINLDMEKRENMEKIADLFKAKDKHKQTYLASRYKNDTVYYVFKNDFQNSNNADYQLFSFTHEETHIVYRSFFRFFQSKSWLFIQSSY